MGELYFQPDRIKQMRDFLRGLDAKQFRYADKHISEFKERGQKITGTVCCALGWLPRAFPEQWRWHRLNQDVISVERIGHPNCIADADEFFGIPEELEVLVFYRAHKVMLRLTGGLTDDASKRVTAEQVAHLLDVVLELGLESVQGKSEDELIEILVRQWMQLRERCESVGLA